jgi:hypothetical protein
MDFANAFARLPGAPKVVFRLHPADDVDSCRERLAGLAAPEGGIELSHGGGGPRTLQLQAEMRYQAGVFSTAVVEGVALGCKTFLLPLSGWTGLSSLIDAGVASLVETPETLLKMIEADSGIFKSPDAFADRLFSPWRGEVLSDFTS